MFPPSLWKWGSHLLRLVSRPLLPRVRTSRRGISVRGSMPPVPDAIGQPSEPRNVMVPPNAHLASPALPPGVTCVAAVVTMPNPPSALISNQFISSSESVPSLALCLFVMAARTVRFLEVWPVLLKVNTSSGLGIMPGRGAWL